VYLDLSPIHFLWGLFYLNELAPISGESERCALFGQFYHLPDPDISLTRTLVALPEKSWGVVSDQDVNDIVCGGAYFEIAGVRKLIAIFQSGEARIYQVASLRKLTIHQMLDF
jgi:hypothetical protein